MPQRPSQEERNWAVLSHASILLAPWTGIGGMVAALAIWISKKGSSRYIAWQSLQAWAYQLAFPMVLAGLGALAWFIFPDWTCLPIRGLVVTAVLMALPVFVGYGCYGAYSCAQGRDFRYLVIGVLMGRWK